MPTKGKPSKRKGVPSINSGMKGNQKMKPYLILQILQHQTDENHLLNLTTIADKLKELGISAERRSVAEDITAINAALYLLQQRDFENEEVTTLQQAIAELEEDDSLQSIVYVSRGKEKVDRGYYFKGRKFDFQEIRLLAETIYTSRFLSEQDAERLAKVLRDYVSEYQAKSIKQSAYVTDRTRSSRSILHSLEIIDEAMATKLDGNKHTPEKISFQYCGYSIVGLKEIERHKGERYKVSPYKVIVTDGNYYLLAYDDKIQKIRTFRIDRMKDVRRAKEPREGLEAFNAIDLKNFTRRCFGMFTGREEVVQIQCANKLLDAMVERFGKQYAGFRKLPNDDRHFVMTVKVEVSDQFFGWLLGFGKLVKIIAPQTVADELREYLKRIEEMY